MGWRSRPDQSSGTSAASRPRRRELEQPEVHFQLRHEGDRFSILGGRAETPLLHRLDRLLVETEAEAPDYLDARYSPGILDLDLKQYGSLIPGLAGFFGVFRFPLEDQDRGPVERRRRDRLFRGWSGAGLREANRLVHVIAFAKLHLGR